VLKELKVRQVRRVLKELKVQIQAHKGQQVHKGQQALKVLKVM
jgi:hypothetical protein